MHYIPRIMATVLVLGLGLGGCSFAPVMSDHVVKYNAMVAKTSDQLLLLNILRAKDRLPMHFTAFNVVRGSYQLSTAGGLTASFGRNPTAPFGATLGLTGTTTPSFELDILDKKKFMSGILMPVSMSLINYYWQQGWPKEMLLHLFIRKIEDKRIKQYVGGSIVLSTPTAPISGKISSELCKGEMSGLEKFQCKIRAMGLRISVGPRKPFGPLMNAETAAKYFDKLVAIKKNGLVLIKNKVGMYQFHKAASFVFCATNKPGSEAKPKEIEWSSEIPCHEPGVVSIAGEQGLVNIAGADIKDVKNRIFVHIRSPEAILYYLGEITRLYERKGIIVPIIKGRRRGEILFFARKADGSPAATNLRVTFNGTTYVIPKTDPIKGKDRRVRSMHVLSLLNQLFALHKEADELPSARAVTVVGR